LRGRKPTPTHLKIVSGNPGRRALNEDEPQPIGELLAAPGWLTDSQKEIWRFAVEHAPKGLLRSLDRDLITDWVTAVDEFQRAEIELQKGGTVIEEGGGQRITVMPDGRQIRTVRSKKLVPSPWTKIRDRASQRIMKATSELGFSPTSRSRISLAGGGKKETNRFANNAANRRA
jgi:P27 family predicted phage terminase small subunit